MPHLHGRSDGVLELCREAAVKHQCVAGDERGLVRGEVQRRGRDLPQRARPPERVEEALAAEFLRVALEPLDSAFGEDAAGAEGIQSNTVAPVMHGARCSGPTTSPPVSRLR
jgi:hypothetical protein